MILVPLILFGVFLIGGVALLFGYDAGYRDGFTDARPDAPRCRVPLCEHAAAPGVAVCPAHWEATVEF